MASAAHALSLLTVTGATCVRWLNLRRLLTLPLDQIWQSWSRQHFIRIFCSLQGNEDLVMTARLHRLSAWPATRLEITCLL